MSRMISARLLASAHSFVQRVQLCLEGLGSASNFLSIGGVGAGLVASYLSSVMIESGSRDVTQGLAVELN